MARPYTNEMSKLGETFAWAAAVDLEPMRQAVRTASLSSLRALGSGGSLTAAHALAALHQRFTGRLAAVATPLEAVNDPLDHSVATWLLSAGGSNVDIMAAAKALILREPRQIGVLCGREDSPLAELCRDHPFIDLLLYPPPVGKDGFLATNSLLAFTTILTHAYTAEFGAQADWDDAVIRLTTLLEPASLALGAWEEEVAQLWARPTTLVLHGPSTRIGAVDLESKFTEAAIGNLQIADYRNFAHGRHHWLAKRGEESGVLAFITEADRTLAERTLDLIPASVPQARISLAGCQSASALASLVAALQITGWAGFTRGIDPGRPGVPEFGRKLYNLSLPRPSRTATQRRLSPRHAAAISRL
jgi:fructoselysine-6-P-deglycase FrlB-like protein